GRVLRRDFLGRDLGFRVVGAGGDRVIGAGIQHRRLQLASEQVVAQLAAVLRRHDFKRVGAWFDRGVPRFAVDFIGDPAHEAIDRRLRVGDVGGDLLVDAAAGYVTNQATRETTAAAFFNRFFDRRVD